MERKGEKVEMKKKWKAEKSSAMNGVRSRFSGRVAAVGTRLQQVAARELGMENMLLPGQGTRDRTQTSGIQQPPNKVCPPTKRKKAKKKI